MGFRRQVPGETGPKGVVTWTALKLDPGSHDEFYALAPTLWFWSHWRGRSVPCYAEFTDGAESCPYCKTRDYWQGYLPCCNDVGQRFLALVKESNKEVTDKLQTGQAIMVSRKRGKGEPYTVRPAMVRKVRVPTAADELAVKSIEGALVVLWRDDFFKQWYAKHGSQEDAFGLALRAAELARRQADATQNALLEGIKQRVKVREQSAGDGPVSVGELVPHVVNGTGHKRKGPGNGGTD